MTLAYIALAVLWLAVIAYAVLGGADFGGGIWALFATGPQADRQRILVEEAIGPVWEANHVWLIFLIVGLFTAFPVAFSVLSVALFVPFTLALVGIVLRGAAFVFHLHAPGASRTRAIWGRTFSAASTITPFLLGTSAAAIASGQIRAPGGRTQTVSWMLWTMPFALTVGAMAVSLCAVLAAIYLTVEAQQARNAELVDAFRIRAIIAGAVTAVFGGLGLIQAPFQAPLLWNGVLGKALPAVIVTMVVGLSAAASLVWGKYRLARVLIILETACLLGSWAVAQLPYLIPPDVTISSAASPEVTLLALLVSTAIGSAFLAPSLWFLFHTFKSSKPLTTEKLGDSAAESASSGS